jgi:LSD1 subclass zinc finger protein
MDETQLRLDGNACGGMLREVFTTDMTAARGACVGCGTVGQVGGQHLYGYPHGPGAVLRCSVCETVLLVLVHTRESYRLGLPGLAWMQI